MQKRKKKKKDEATQLVLAQRKFCRNKNTLRHVDGDNYINWGCFFLEDKQVFIICHSMNYTFTSVEGIACGNINS